MDDIVTNGTLMLIGANFDDIPVNNLILRRPPLDCARRRLRGRLEGWATHEIVEEAGS
jgi:hypothetical protein